MIVPSDTLLVPVLFSTLNKVDLGCKVLYSDDTELGPHKVKVLTLADFIGYLSKNGFTLPYIPPGEHEDLKVAVFMFTPLRKEERKTTSLYTSSAEYSLTPFFQTERRAEDHPGQFNPQIVVTLNRTSMSLSFFGTEPDFVQRPEPHSVKVASLILMGIRYTAGFTYLDLSELKMVVFTGDSEHIKDTAELIAKDQGKEAFTSVVDLFVGTYEDLIAVRSCLQLPNLKSVSFSQHWKMTEKAKNYIDNLSLEVLKLSLETMEDTVLIPDSGHLHVYLDREEEADFIVRELVSRVPHLGIDNTLYPHDYVEGDKRIIDLINLSEPGSFLESYTLFPGSGAAVGELEEAGFAADFSRIVVELKRLGPKSNKSYSTSQ
uniref:Uncharacterized protein n=1 Tax=viral metagenome TaxID=1070528 RepID=A0A6C0JUP7_9ZZZZ